MRKRHRPGTFIVVPSRHRLPKIDAIGQSIFMWLNAHADDRGLCYPSINRIAGLCRKSKNTVKNRIRKLEELGLVKKFIRKKDNGENKSNLYQIIEDDWMPEDSGGSRNDLPISTLARQVDHHLVTNETQYEQRYNNSRFQKNSSISYLKNIPEEDISKLIKDCGVSRQFIEKKAKDVMAYCTSRGKGYGNYRSALKGFIEKDLKKNGVPTIEKRTGSMKQINDILSARNNRDP